MILTIHDENTGAPAATARLFTLPDAKMTARELIRQRVMHEVRQYNDSPTEPFLALVKLSDEELASNSAKRLLDPERQVSKAFESFRQNGFALRVDGALVESLDQELQLSANSQISFVRLSPVAAG